MRLKLSFLVAFTTSQAMIAAGTTQRRKWPSSFLKVFRFKRTASS